MKKLVGVVALALILCGTIDSEAGLVQTTWTATYDTAVVSSIASTHFTIGETFSVTATYDDAGAGYIIWGDGADGRANFGSNDDTNGGSSGIYGSYTSFSNANFLVTNSNWDDYLSDARHFDSFQNFSKVGIISSSYPFLQTQFDGVRLYAKAGSSPSFRIMEMTDDSSSSDVGGFSIISIETAQLTPGPVPEPATMLLMGTGIAGLVGSRVRRNKKG